MSNKLDNGTVLPFGLLSGLSASMSDGFKKTYQNTSLKVGIVMQSYSISDPKNITKIFPEYDVMTFEQNEDQGSTVITYKNCIAASSFGSIADYFEANIRKLKNKTSKGVTPSPSGQDGSIVLLLCLNGLSDKGVIVGCLSHPDRPTNLVDDGPMLEGEYNGVNIKVDKDGSATFTFKGATANDGTLIDPSQGPTEVRVEKDGSYQVSHKTITQRFDKKGVASLTADDNITNTTKKDFDVTADGGINLTATKDLNAKMNQLIMEAQGNASLACQALDVNVQSNIDVKGIQLQIDAQALARINAPIITLNGFVSLGGDGGQPVLLLSTIMLGRDSVGAPVVSTPIGGYATKTLAQ